MRLRLLRTGPTFCPMSKPRGWPGAWETTGARENMQSLGAGGEDRRVAEALALAAADADPWAKQHARLRAGQQQLDVICFLVGPIQRDPHYSWSKGHKPSDCGNQRSAGAIGSDVGDLPYQQAVGGVDRHTNQSCIRLGRVDVGCGEVWSGYAQCQQSSMGQFHSQSPLHHAVGALWI